ncbi:hypothetical protein N0V90_010989 [Kalmusia sp. IMI 367209]|nr:hypothetical protein N0V90_010989 [Kalmusia sp. IMI 367209]
MRLPPPHPLLGMHKVLPFSRYELPSLDTSDHRINLVATQGWGQKEMIAEGITIKQLYDDFIKPGQMLYMVDKMDKEQAKHNADDLEEDRVAQKYNTFAIVKPRETAAHVSVGKNSTRQKAIAHANPAEVAHLQSLREVHLLLHSPPDYWKLMLDKAYRFIEASCPVEFSIRVRNVTVTKLERSKPSSRDLMHYVHLHFPHLRPDFILKSMPAGARYIIEPFSDGRHVQFVIGLKSKHDPLNGVDLTERLEQVKRSVQRAVEEGKANRLPRAARFDCK